ncbi:mannitol dehydrogenase family protein [Parasphaerochaeta coccoides]|uniref:Mannitol 2-dehydrogenase n=1 Tax=Parasphaerochaeta coccoides (strain ATCC BAA-1237 / DSM 17374 / SPN1) TaxID=760011 RepID=F4GL56_PARC1|nr:mannitol dehydrogenase family protein [Parasphaerochaeta coccoides]AEC02396.1 Mannitol 2-dehydrogenase [Parasphaerochaeta coccoides DSM 17374]
MKLTDESIKDRCPWEEKGYGLPSFDREAMKEKTRREPRWVHIGAGNIFRAFPAVLHQRLLDEGLADTGIIVGEGFDPEIISSVYTPCDNLSLLVVLKSDGSIEKKVIASVAEARICDQAKTEDWEYFSSVFRSPSLQMVSFTITEKGYSLTDSSGAYTAMAEKDFAAGPAMSVLLVSRVAALLHERFRAGGHPLALVSMDNCSHNGEKLGSAIIDIVHHWEEVSFVDSGFLAYVSNPSTVSFPWSMIDKITPRPDEGVKKMLEADGFKDTGIVVTARKTWTAPFVNAEEAQYLVVEDSFPNGRPVLERAGVYFTDRDTVNKVEKMKVCTCLNPLHTALAIFGCLLGYTLISEEMKDPQLKRLVEKIGYDEGLPVVVNPGILDPRAFIKEVVEVRFPNPFMPDTPQRIASDTSQKLAIRFGETIKVYVENPSLDVSGLKFIPLVFAGWLRYLMGRDDEDRVFELSPDPLASEAGAYVKDVRLGHAGPVPGLDGLLRNSAVFGVNLVEVGMVPLVLEYFYSLVAGKGAVRDTLVRLLGT